MAIEYAARLQRQTATTEAAAVAKPASDAKAQSAAS